jgi:release factor glutamine methyltransferase
MHRVIDIISLSTDYLRKHGVPHPRRNAELLLSEVLGKSRLALYLQHDKPLVEDELRTLRKLLRARAAHKPIQYVLGKTEFYSFPFLIEEGVFIPRPETEILVAEVTDALQSLSRAKEIVIFDVGTGCGCIAVSLAARIERCKVYASDISSQALALARRNAEMNSVSERIIFLEGNLFQPFTAQNVPKADAIVSNPPYVAEEEWESLPEEVRGYEPRESLLAGKGGLDFLRRIVASAHDLLNPGGRLFLEIGHGQIDSVFGFFRERQNYVDITSRKDYNDTERVVSARSSLADKSIVVE